MNDDLDDFCDYLYDDDSFVRDCLMWRVDKSEIFKSKHKENHFNVLIKRFDTAFNKEKYLKGNISIKSRNIPFILPSIGITKDSKSVIYAYSSFDNLYFNINVAFTIITLTNTQKMKILIAILICLKKMHQNSIVHKNIRSSCIYLDRYFLPLLSDLDIETIDLKYYRDTTDSCGFPTWIAPEVFEDNEFTTKSDVFSFGLLIFEIFAGYQLFTGFNFVQMKEFIKNECIKNAFPEEFPNILKEIVIQCLRFDPVSRPSIEEVYESFIKLNSSVDDVDFDEINNFIEKINKSEKKHLSIINLNDKSEFSYYISEFHSSNLKFSKSIQFPKETKLELNDIHSSQFISSLQILFASTDESNFMQNINQILPLLKTVDSREITSFILSELSSTIKRNQNCASMISEFVDYLHLDDSYFAVHSLSILFYAIKQYPKILTPHIASTIIEHINICPKQLIGIFGFYSDAFYYLENPLDVIDVFLNNSHKFIQEPKTAESFCRVIFSLQTQHKDFKVKRAEYCHQIYISALFVDDIKAVRQALTALRITYDESLEFPQDVVTKLLDNALVREHALNYLILSQKLEKKQELFDYLMKDMKDEKTILLLCRLIKDGGHMMMINNTEWMKSKAAVENLYRLFLLMFAYNEIREKLVSSPDFVYLANRICAFNNKTVISQISNILSKTVNKNLVDILRKNRFLEKFFSLATNSTDEANLLSALQMINVVEDISQGNEVNVLMPRFKALFEHQSKQVRLEAFKTAINLSKYDNIKRMMESYRINGSLGEEKDTEVLEYRNKLNSIIRLD